MEGIHAHYQEKKSAIQQRLKDFSLIPESEYFYELCFCLLTPASSAKVCDAAVWLLKKQQFHANDIDPFSSVRLVRFNKTKAARLLKIKQQFPEILNQIKNEKDPVALRLWLYENVDGLGLKESAHFLRNIGYRNLGILDRHILKHLHRNDVIHEIPKSMTRKRYLEIERKFQEFSRQVSIPIDELDLLFWSMETGEIFK